jgi:ornithine cyclodeaminase
MLVVSQAEVRELLPMQECIHIMTEALKAVAQGDALLPLRTSISVPDVDGTVFLMPSGLRGVGFIGVKVISVYPNNHGSSYDSHQGVVLLFDKDHGQLVAMMDASEITAIRTAAVSGVATQILAREDAGDLAILGSGAEARTHLQAMTLVRRIRSVRVWSRDIAHAQRFADLESARHGLAIEACQTAQAAVDSADIVCTVTSSPEPILKGEWLADGSHINAVGSSNRSTRELDTLAVVRSTLFVDRLESALNEAGDVLLPKQEGAIGDDHIKGELGEILLGRIQGRKTPGEITTFKSLGLAIEDLASAESIYRRALKERRGTMLDLNGIHGSLLERNQNWRQSHHTPDRIDGEESYKQA